MQRVWENVLSGCEGDVNELDGSESLRPAKIDKRSARAAVKQARMLTEQLIKARRMGEAPGVSEKWISENLHYIEQIAEMVENDLHGLKKLPSFTQHFNGGARIYVLIARAVELHSGGIDIDQIEEAISDYMQKKELTTDEVNSSMSMARLSLLEILHMIAGQAMEDMRARHFAEQLAPKIVNNPDNRLFRKAAQLMEKYHEAFVERLATELRGHSDQQKAMEAEQKLSEALGVNLDEAASAYHTHCAERGVAAANAISSLRALDGVDFRESVKRVSPAFGILMHDKTFANMDEQSHDHYLSAVIRLAKKGGMPESAVANKAMEYCSGKDGIEGHVGYYLVGYGRKTFAASLGIKVNSISEQRRKRQLLYFVPLFTIGLGLIAALDIALILDEAFILEVIGCTLMGLVLFFAIAQDAVNRFITMLKPSFLPKMGYEQLPDDCATVLCVPIVAFSEKDVHEYIDSLEVRYHSFNGANAYILLCDLFETNEQHKPADDAIIATGKKAAEQLGHKLGASIIFAYRLREYAEKDKVWRGYDRKRGALHELNKALRHGDSKLVFCGGRLPENTQFVITLDADTYLAPGEGIRLANAMAHPLNRDEGYGIIQPRMSTNASSRTNSRIARLYAADGMDFYSQAASEVYMDISGEGNYAGKGIYHVDTFMRSAEDVIRPGTVLSHDLLEGSLAHCALATDIQAVDGFPQHYTSWAKREHRWVRGDWQLAPYVFGRPKGKDGKRIRISALSRWKMFDNLRRSMLPFCVTQMFALGATFGSLPWPVYCVIAFSPYWFAIVMDALTAMIRTVTRGINAGIVEFKALKKRIYRNVAGFILCAFEADIGVDGAVRSLYRVFISHRRLLQWVTAEQAEKGDAVNLPGYFRMMAVPLAFDVAVFIITIMADPNRLYMAIPICAMWALSPIYAYWLDRGSLQRELTGEENEYFTKLAKDTWGFFVRYANKQNGYLAPDNAQIAPLRPEVLRTSPTNMGFSVLAPVNAYNFKFIDKEELVTRIDGAISSMEKMEKWNGHLYNWYDIRKQQPTKPMYVSTVDSGNLAACLITVAEKLRSLNEHKLAERADALAYAMDFSKLFDKTQMLMTIGYDCTQQQLTKSYYDLYASESRITSLFAIAAGQVPVKHWRATGRPATRMGSRNLTLSWSGTAFEYLMPSIFITPHFDTFERRTCSNAIMAQLAYAKERRIPFGISESGFASFDPSGYYQYRAFGIPTLSVRSIPRDEAVVSPYSTALIAMFMPEKAMKNYMWLEEQGARGRYGFYEAVDYSGAERGSVVRSFMAHHQGMALASLDNVVNDGSIRKLFESVMRIQAVLPLAGHVDSRLPAKRRRNNPERERLVYRTPRSVSRQKPGTQPSAALLAGGGYSMYVTQNGSGGATVDGQSVYKSATDNCLEDGGVYVYVRCNGQNMSPCILPTRPKGLLSSSFEPHKVVHGVKNGKVSVQMETCVEPGSGNEIRMITIDNGMQDDMDVEVCVAFEPVVSKKQDHDSHPAYSSLFLHTSIEDGVLMCERRPRYIQGQRQRVYMGLFGEGEMEYETDRQLFIGRNGSYASPQAMDKGFSGSLGSVINPVMAQKRVLTVEAGHKESVCAVIGIAPDAAQAVSGAKAFESASAAKRAFSAAESFAQAQTRYFGLDGKEVLNAFGHATRLIYSTQQCITGRAARLKLFEHGVSGDQPVAMLSVQKDGDIDTLNAELKRKALLSRRGLTYDLIIADMCGNAYLNPIRQKLQESLSSYRAYNGNGQQSSVHVAVMDERERDMLQTCIYGSMLSAKTAPRKLNTATQQAKQPELPQVELASEYGGFTQDGDEYTMLLKRGQDTPAPWSNIVANERLGFICTERGAGYTYAENAREYKLTPWSCDPVANPHGEALFIKDEVKGNAFCPLGGPVHPQSVLVSHGHGYSVYESSEGGISAQTTLFADATLPVKVVRVKLKNESKERKRINATYIADLVLSSSNQPQRGRITAHYDADNSAVFAHNGFEQDFPHLTTFLGATEEGIEYELSRESVLGSCADMSAPLCMNGELTSPTGDECGGCVAMRLHIQLSPGESKEFGFLIGAAERAEIPGILRKYRGRGAAQRGLDEVIGLWKQRLGKVKISTPLRSLDIMVNKWLPYQVYASRLFSRTGFYQAGGAFGFRDQLQDAISLLAHDPELCCRQIIRCASHQFTEGDVQHWWHEPARGVRTKISDDLLFLPYAVAEYIRTTGDSAILDESAPFLKPQDILEGEEDIYYAAEPDGEGSIYEHCLRAIWKGATKGEHGLPLMGTGDWNDGMNRVGRGGRGESVWLGFFVYHVLDKFKPIAAMRKDGEAIERMQEIMDGLSDALGNMLQDGRILRAFLDDGTPLGAEGCPENAFDLISPAWAAISKAVSREMAEQGLNTAVEHLYDDKAGLLRLLWPPFDKWDKDVGYIQGYLPGVRENGGQYSHGAMWGLCALCELGWSEKAVEIFSAINPAEKATDAETLATYRCEPYVFPADIYSVNGNAGRSGWTWYTGSAGWAIRFALEWLLGIRIVNGKPEVNPCIPASWPGYTAELDTADGKWIIDVYKDDNGSSAVDISRKQQQDRHNGVVAIK